MATLLDLSFWGAIHVIGVAIGCVLGPFQLARRKGTPLHRVVGYVYVGAMVAGDLAALFVQRFTGGLNILHAGAVLNLVCIGLALSAILRIKDPARRIQIHAGWMYGSYVGLVAAGMTELFVRNWTNISQGEAWAVTLIVTVAVTLAAFAAAPYALRRA